MCSSTPLSNLTNASLKQGDSMQNLSNGLDTISYRVPLGVCAGIGMSLRYISFTSSRSAFCSTIATAFYQ